MIMNQDKRNATLKEKYGEDFNIVIANKSKQSFFENHRKSNPDLYESTVFLDEHYESVPITQRQWHIDNNILTVVMCRTCEQNLAPFDKKHKLYKNCSKDCHKKELGKKASISNANPLTQKKKLDTFIERYGSENPYAIIGKTMKATNLEKYGVESIHHTPENRKKYLISRLKTFKEKELIADYQMISDSLDLLSLKHISCGNIFTINPHTYYNRKIKNQTICTECLPLFESFPENDLYQFIKSIYHGKITRKDRKCVKGFEVDIYFPDLKIGIEFNGLYWHSEIYKDKYYHRNKNLAANANGIKLIQIWEDTWINRKYQVSELIKSLINDNNEIITEFEIKKLDSNVISDFLNKYHINGTISFNDNRAIVHKGNIIQIMVFSKINENKIAITRLCKINDYVIQDGYKKLFEDFLLNNRNIKIIAIDSYFVNNDIFVNMGLAKTKTLPPDYCYFDCKKSRKPQRINRIKFRKSVLVKQGFDPNKSEHTICNENGYYRIYDAGSEYYELIK